MLRGGIRLWSLHITVKTSKDNFKNQATYPEGDHTVFKQEYWNHLTRKRPKGGKYFEIKENKYKELRIIIMLCGYGKQANNQGIFWPPLVNIL